ncbi:hypothetical protein E2C01_086310 [Portunus trituberculatus]|uniref:Uncharacterized protein n=1 Tax=Portunus trituberculatus TaxID=210409 RepID=A0A5B7JB58_PORTR|nr:hypothetical protein [Portunus trituberculatus]
MWAGGRLWRRGGEGERDLDASHATDSTHRVTSHAPHIMDPHSSHAHSPQPTLASSIMHTPLRHSLRHARLPDPQHAPPI